MQGNRFYFYTDETMEILGTGFAALVAFAVTGRITVPAHPHFFARNRALPEAATALSLERDMDKD